MCLHTIGGGYVVLCVCVCMCACMCVWACMGAFVCGVSTCVFFH